MRISQVYKIAIFIAVLSMAHFANAMVLFTQPDNTGSVTINGNPYNGTIYTSTLATSTFNANYITFDVISGASNLLTVNFNIVKPDNSSRCSMSATLNSFGGSVTSFTTGVQTYLSDANPCTFYAGDKISFDANTTGNVVFGGSAPYPFISITDDGTGGGPMTDYSTHFVSTSPTGTVSTTTTTGASIYINPADISNTSSGARLFATFSQSSSFACMNSGAVYDAIYKCTGANSPVLPFSIDYNVPTGSRLLAGSYNISTTTTFTGGGAWSATYFIQNVSYPWYFLGLEPTYTTIISTTTSFVIGTTSLMDATRGEIQSVQALLASTTGLSIGSLLASTTASIGSACNIFTGGDIGSCIALMVYPPDSTIQDDATILENLPPWGYAFRFYNILTATTTSSTLPVISYSFATSSPMAAIVGTITFDPLGGIEQSGAIINSWQSDHGGGNFFQIFEPFIKVVVYLALFIELGRELLAFDWGGEPKEERNLN